MHIKPLVLLLGFLSIFSCQQSNIVAFSLEPKKAPRNLVNFIDTILFNIGHNSSFYKRSNMGITDDGTYLCFIDDNRELYCFNLLNKTLFSKKNKSLYLNSNRIEGICFYSLDSIFVFYKNEILITDTAGKSKNSINTFNLDPLLRNYVIESITLNDIKPYFNSTKNSIYFAIRSNNAYSWTITHPFEAGLNLRTLKIEFCEINYPERFHQNTYGWLEKPVRAWNNNLHIYSFPPEPNLYSYNLQTKEKKVIGGKSTFQNMESKILTSGTKRKDIIKSNTYEDNYENIVESCYYGSFIFDPYSKKYYRLFYLPLPTKLDSIRYNTMNEKKAKLMVFNENFELEDEIDFELDNYSDFYPSKIGLIFRIPNRSYDKNNPASMNFYFKVLKFNN